MDYLEHYAISQSHIRQWMEHDQFTEEEINYALDNCGVDFAFEALERAREIDAEKNVSERYLCSLLEDEGFSHDEASYAAAYCGADWVSEATNIASNYIAEVPSATYDELYQYLTVSWLFYEDQANAACAVYGLTP